ncbi:MAG: hypothetical protein QF927_04625 [Verrucomicrobiota bacterium]|nr:hypothetical protein [Verrucomicrobiota bacterium]
MSQENESPKPQCQRLGQGKGGDDWLSLPSQAKRQPQPSRSGALGQAAD